MPEKEMKILLKQPLNLILQYGNEVLESFNLIKTSQWLKVIVQNDSMLFLCRFEENVRRFRIKFDNNTHKSSLDACKDFTKAISKYINVQNTDQKDNVTNNLQTTDNNVNDGKSITFKSVVQNILDNRVSSLPSYYQSTNLKDDKVGTSNLIKTCLLDPNFPCFVESVESTLKEMIDE